MSYKNKLFALSPAVVLAAFVLSGCGAGDPETSSTSEAEPSSTEETSPSAPASQDGRSVEQHLADATLAAEVRKALAADDSLRRFDFEPEVSGGRVTLRGMVETAAQQSRSADVARAVEGVRGVTNDVTLVADSIAVEPGG